MFEQLPQLDKNHSWRLLTFSGDAISGLDQFSVNLAKTAKLTPSPATRSAQSVRMTDTIRPIQLLLGKDLQIININSIQQSLLAYINRKGVV
jgi:hypothetical protein